MNNICTSLEQSKKLIELGIDIHTADMYWFNAKCDEYLQGLTPYVIDDYFNLSVDIPAWSLPALMELMNRNCYNISLNCHGAEWNIKFDDSEEYKDFTKDYPLDTAFEMVCWLKENKML